MAHDVVAEVSYRPDGTPDQTGTFGRTLTPAEAQEAKLAQRQPADAPIYGYWERAEDGTVYHVDPPSDTPRRGGVVEARPVTP